MLTSNRPSLDDPDTTVARGDVILSKPILKAFYDSCYNFFSRQLESLPSGAMLELGSGGGYLKNILPDVITSEYLSIPTVDLTCSAAALPFPPQSLSAIFMVDVLHHIQNVSAFFREAELCLGPGGIIALVEPANTLWGRFIYSNFHHEPFEPTAPNWSLPDGGPLSMANGALPWIVFKRDKNRFEREHPQLQVEAIDLRHPILYLASGGFSTRQLFPGKGIGILHGIEKCLSPINSFAAMFMFICIRKGSPSHQNAENTNG